jgi:tetratricopeptide (TPR) repeat protein
MKLWARAKTLFARDKDPDPSAALADAAFREAIAHHQQGRLGEAASFYSRALELQPDHVAALNFLGVLAYQDEDPARSVALIEKAIALDASQPGFHSNLALSLNAVGRARDAIESCDRAIALDPKCVEAYSNKGNSLWGLGRREEALSSYAQALALQPDHAQTHWNEGFLRMQLGLFETGWAKQEWRWRLAHRRADLRDFAQPLWLGKEDLQGKTILLHAEQGFGDTIQFSRYAKLVAKRGAIVILEVQKPLRDLMKTVKGVSYLVARGDPLPAFDYHCPLLSLPLAFGTSLKSIPAERHYLRCDPSVVGEWRERLGQKTRPRVGLVWKASAENKSVSLAALLELVTPDKQFFSLQTEVSAADQALLDSRKDVAQMSSGLRNFADAPLVDLMDVVVTVDTSMAHLAGALGRPVWVLLPFNPEWRWLLERRDSPWYPSARLFRQPAAGDWTSVIANVRTELASVR